MSEVAIKNQSEACSAGCDSKNTQDQIQENEKESDDSETEGADDVNEDSEVDEVVGVDKQDCVSSSAHGDEDIDEDSESLDPRIQAGHIKIHTYLHIKTLLSRYLLAIKNCIVFPLHYDIIL